MFRLYSHLQVCHIYKNAKIILKLNEIWDEVYTHSNANSAYCAFLSKFRKYFFDLFQLKKL
jgi:hypothetical protein